MDRDEIGGYNIFEKRAGILLKEIAFSNLPRNVKIRSLYKIERQMRRLMDELEEEDPLGYTE